MKTNEANLFETLKRNKKIITKKPAISEIFFQLRFDDVGAYVAVIDDRQKEIDAEYEFYSGNTRELLKAINHIQERSVFRIDWTAPNGRTYLHEYEYLIWQLKNNSNFVDEKLQPLKFIDDPANLII